MYVGTHTYICVYNGAYGKPVSYKRTSSVCRNADHLFSPLLSLPLH